MIIITEAEEKDIKKDSQKELKFNIEDYYVISNDDMDNILNKVKKYDEHKNFFKNFYKEYEYSSKKYYVVIAEKIDIQSSLKTFSNSWEKIINDIDNIKIKKVDEKIKKELLYKSKSKDNGDDLSEENKKEYVMKLFEQTIDYAFSNSEKNILIKKNIKDNTLFVFTKSRDTMIKFIFKK